MQESTGLQRVWILLFEEFETLDVFGPVELFGVSKDDYRVAFYSESGGIIRNSHGVGVDSQPLENILDGVDVFLLPGGFGTRREVNNVGFIDKIRSIAERSTWVLTVCTGSALLAKTGLLDNRAATSNKKAFDWVVTNGENVKWDPQARWTADDKFYTSAGVSAGIDMVLGFLGDRHGMLYAENLALHIEYNWCRKLKYI